jgi:hypothetical protein
MHYALLSRIAPDGSGGDVLGVNVILLLLSLK